MSQIQLLIRHVKLGKRQRIIARHGHLIAFQSYGVVLYLRAGDRAGDCAAFNLKELLNGIRTVRFAYLVVYLVRVYLDIVGFLKNWYNPPYGQFNMRGCYEHKEIR